MLLGKHPTDHRGEELLAVVGKDVAVGIKGIEIRIARAGVSVGNYLIFSALNTLKDDRGLGYELAVFGVVRDREAIAL